MKKIKNIIIVVFTFAVFGFIAPVSNFSYVYADGEKPLTNLAMSPMYEKIILVPGQSYTSEFSIISPANSQVDFDYKIYAQNYYRDENNNAIFEDVNGTGKMVDWITIDSPTTGTLTPNESRKVQFTINVPEDAPAGGQYAAITVATASPENVGQNGGISIREQLAIAYTVYAEIAGNTVRQGEIYDLNLPSFLFSGEIVGSAMVKNTGNVHDDAKYTLQIFPLFSNEEVYTNEENPDTRLVLPNRTLYHENVWDNTPMVGIFNAVYTVEFEGLTSQISKMIIVCPLWLLFIILFVIIALIIWIMIRIRVRKKSSERVESNQ